MGMGMIHTTWRRRAVTTVVAGASAIALAAPSVSAAPAGPDQFAGLALAKALDLEVTLPSGLAVPAGSIEQLISQTLTELDSQGKIAAKSILASGALLNESLSFSGGKKSDTKQIAAQDLGIVKVGLGTMKYEADAEKGVTRALSELANLKVGLSQSDAQDLIDDVMKRLEDLVGTPGSTATPGSLNKVLEDIEKQANLELPPGQEIDIPPLSLKDVAPVVVPTGVPQLPEVSDLTNLVSIKKLWSETSTLTEAASDAIISTSEAGVIDMSLLGGLVTVPEYVFSSVAKTNGKPGGAKAEAVTRKLAVQLTGNDVISIEGDTLTVGGEEVDLGDLDLDAQLAQLNELLGSILKIVGLDIEQAKETEVAAADGSHALASTDALVISLSPLNVLRGGTENPAAGGLNVALSLLPTESEVRAGNVAPVAQPRPPAAIGRQPQPSLPRTGAGSVAVLLGGLALGGAFALRRFTKS